MFKFVKMFLCASVLALCTATCALAQVTTINGAAIYPYEFKDDKDSMLTVVNNYPTLISFDDEMVSQDDPGTFANRHTWRFSDDGGTSAYQFSNDDFFEVSMTLTLTGGNTSPRKEAGFLFDTAGGQGQFIVNTDGHEVVMFGGPFPFYAFPKTFNSGDTVTLGMTYFLDTDGKRKIIYHANTPETGPESSPPQTFTNLEQGIIGGTTLGGYLQVVIDTTNPNNFGKAVFQNITITPLTGNIVSGTLTFEGISSTAPNQNVTFTFRPVGGGASFTKMQSVPANGAFTLPGVPAGMYNLLIKGDKYLAQNVLVDTTGGNVATVTSTQFAGDANNDNMVDIADFSALVAVYSDTYTPGPTAPAADVAADFNSDGTIDTGDFGLLVNNYGSVGDM